MTGNLEIIDTLCTVIENMSGLINRMVIELEQADIAEEVKRSMMQEKAECEKKLNNVWKTSR